MSGIKKIVVTGGLGALGKYVVSELSTHYDVTIVSRSVPETSDSVKEVDVRDLEGLKAVFRGQDAVIHLAGLDSIVAAEPKEFMEVNTFGTWCVFEAAAANKIKNVVYCSSEAVYGIDHSKEGIPTKLPLNESHAMRAYRPYGLSKVFGERIAESYAHRYGMSVCSLRVSAVVFPSTIEELVTVLDEDKDTWKDTPADLAKDLSLASSPNVPPYRTYVEAEDAARAFRCAIEHATPGHRTYNICAYDSLVPFHTLDFVGRIVGERMPPYDKKTYQNNPRASVFSNAKAGVEIGWRPENTWEAISKKHFNSER